MPPYRQVRSADSRRHHGALSEPTLALSHTTLEVFAISRFPIWEPAATTRTDDVGIVVATNLRLIKLSDFPAALGGSAGEHRHDVRRFSRSRQASLAGFRSGNGHGD